MIDFESRVEFSRTEELRKQLELAVDNITYKLTTTPPGNYFYQVDRKKLITETLKACKEAGLAFVVKDAELPIPKEVNDFIEGWRPLSETEKHLIMSAYNMMLKAGYRKTEEM